jgi:hypothetical protein
MSGGVCEPRHENGSTEYRASFLCVKLGDSASTTHGNLQQAFGDDAMSRAQSFHLQNIFSKAEPLLKVSSAADDYQHSTGKRTDSS